MPSHCRLPHPQFLPARNPASPAIRKASMQGRLARRWKVGEPAVRWPSMEGCAFITADGLRSAPGKAPRMRQTDIPRHSSCDTKSQKTTRKGDKSKSTSTRKEEMRCGQLTNDSILNLTPYCDATRHRRSGCDLESTSTSCEPSPTLLLVPKRRKREGLLSL
jgi:hypothetical protein